MSSKTPIKNIWFDLGGVLMYQNPVSEPISRFQELGFLQAGEYMGDHGQKGFMFDVETGRISSEQFIEELSHKCGRTLKFEEVLWAWMGFVSCVPQAPLDYVMELRGRYRLSLMSNTNPFIQHWARSSAFSEKGFSIRDYFHDLFCSHEVGAYKPAPEIYLRALEATGILPGETLFIDDSQKNLDGAAALGIRTLLINKDMDFIKTIQEYLDREDQ